MGDVLGGTGGSRRRVPQLTRDHAAAGVIPRLREVVLAQPDAVAVADAHDTLSYLDLAAAAARALVAVRQAMDAAGPDGSITATGEAVPIGVLHGHDAGAVAALLGVLASGHPVLVLDPKTPPPRLRQFVERVGVRLIVADESHEAVAHELTGLVVVPRRAPAADPQLLWQSPPAPTRPAAIAFTSGSTGTPKAVVNDHRMLVRDAWTSAVATGCYGADDVLAHTLPIAFHAGLTTTVHVLMVGATMRLYNTRSVGIGRLPAWLAEHGATVMVTSPAILRALVTDRPDPAQLAGLRSVTIAGEAAYGRDVDALRALLPPSCVVRHRYGSSETGLIAEYPIRSGQTLPAGALPVGPGVGDTRLAVLDADGRPAEPGQPGTVTITAPYLASGYWGDPAATAAAFTIHPDGSCTYRTSDVGRLSADGCLQLVGRADHSVKIRGYLVDPGEVDAALFALPQVREAVVVGLPRPTGTGTRLVGYVAAADPALDDAGVRAALRDQLPGHMVPQTVVFLDALPRTDRGKIDRAALPPPPPPPPTGGGLTTGWEDLIADVWADVLELDRVRPEDDFFELGGDSLAAEAIMARVVADLGVSAEVATTATLVAAPTLRGFATRLLAGRSRTGAPSGRSRTGAPSGQDGCLVPLQPTGSRLPLFLVAGGGGLGLAFVSWARRLGPEQPTWALQSPGLEGRSLPDLSVRWLARRYLAAVRRVQPNGPYQLAGHSFGGLVAFEMAHQLAEAGEQVALLGILDSFPPDPAVYPPTEPTTVGQRIRTAVGLTVLAARSTPGGEDHWRFYDRSDELGRRYRGRRPWPGRALVVLADSPERDLRARWAPHLSGDFTVVEVPGDHLQMTRLPWANAVADALAGAIELAGRDLAAEAARAAGKAAGGAAAGGVGGSGDADGPGGAGTHGEPVPSGPAGPRVARPRRTRASEAALMDVDHKRAGW